ncbi:MAG: response regulator [Bdellovibrionota bacterium]
METETHPGTRAFFLLVDDDSEILHALKSLLFDIFNVRLKTANSGEAAAEVLRKFPVDLVVSDVSMPDGTGLWLHDFMKRERPRTPLLFYTANVDNTLPPLDGVLQGKIEKLDIWGLIATIERLGFAPGKTGSERRVLF